MSAYFSLSTNNVERTQIKHILKGTPWKFHNLLPIPVHVYVYRPVKLDLVGIIPAKSTISTLRTSSGMALEEDDEIHILYSAGLGGPKYEICRPVKLFADSRTVRIGDVLHEARTNTMTQRTHTDIVGLRIHNHISIPMHIYYKNDRIGSMASDDGTNFMAGSPGSVYLTNDNEGFKIGDQLDFVLNWSGKEVPYCTILITDNYMSDVYVGDINQHYTPFIQDQYSYRVDQPNVTGLKYFKQITGYTSIPTC